MQILQLGPSALSLCGGPETYVCISMKTRENIRIPLGFEVHPEYLGCCCESLWILLIICPDICMCSLNQWFSTRGDCAPQDTATNV